MAQNTLREIVGTVYRVKMRVASYSLLKPLEMLREKVTKGMPYCFKKWDSKGRCELYWCEGENLTI